MQDDDKTVIMPSSDADMSQKASAVHSNGVRVTLIGPYSSLVRETFFARNFTIGRAYDNDFVIPDATVSRHHLEIKIEYGEWYIYDVGSTNGAFINDEQVKTGSKLFLPCVIRLGNTDSYIQISSINDDDREISNLPQVDSSDVTQIAPKSNTQTISTDELSKDDIERRFLGKDSDGVGEYTQMVRNIIHEDKRKKTRKYKWGIWVISIFLCVTIGFVIYQQTVISKARNLAIDMFYDMKELEVNISLAEIKLQEESSSSLQESIRAKREKLQGMQKKYKSYIDELNSLKFTAKAVRKVTRRLGISHSPSTEYERELILRVAQKLGECELEVPDGFVDEVNNYINNWKSTSRLKNAMKRLEENNYAPVVIDALKEQNLPLQFLYLSLQESGFDERAIGPETKYGIAKGAWQFLPGTAKDFGVNPGPLSNSAVYDPEDERFDFDKAAYGAAKYLKHIYSTEAQASALLVMAGYNYGHNRVKKMIRKMPDNPRDRNFWKFIQQYKIPEETHKYVFYIFSAAVIGEDPQYFGFDFQSPTSGYE